MIFILFCLSPSGKVLDPFEFGARDPQVEEPLLTAQEQLFRSEILFQVEFNSVAEPKALNPSDLRDFVKNYGSYKKAAQALGISEAFVRQHCLHCKPNLF